MQQSTYVFKVVVFKHYTGYTISICKTVCIHVYKNIPNIHAYTYKIYIYLYIYGYICTYLETCTVYMCIYYACVGINYEYYI